jgi:hypothetical protein
MQNARYNEPAMHHSAQTRCVKTRMCVANRKIVDNFLETVRRQFVAFGESSKTKDGRGGSRPRYAHDQVTRFIFLWRSVFLRDPHDYSCLF